MGRENKMFFTIRPTMRFQVAFGLFGMSENSSFSSTLWAWFAFAHTSPPTGVTTKQIPCGTLPIPAFPNQGKEHSVGFLLTWEGGLQDTLPNSGRARVGSGQIIVIPSYDPFFVTLNFTKRTAAAK